MQHIKLQYRFTTSDAPLPAGRRAFSLHGSGLIAFCFLHLALLVVAGYFIVQWQMPAITKLILLGVACFSSLWLFCRRSKQGSFAQK